MGNHIHIFNTQAEYEANKQNITPPFIAYVKENNKMGMHADKTVETLFNFQRKNVNIVENGSFTIEPDSGYGALSSVNVKVNVPTSDSPTGGGGNNTSNSSNNITYYDYDGTVLYSYTKDEFLALENHPELPSRLGLTCQGWNWDLAEAKAYVAKYDVLNIGATYITDDGKTRLYIKIAVESRMDVPLYFSQTVANGVTIDWGDGSATQTLSGTSNNVNTTHNYTSIGDYCITLSVSDGCTLGLGHNSSSSCVMGNTNDSGKVYCNMLQRVEIGSGVTSIRQQTFRGCYSISSIVIPNGVTNIDSSAFYYCYSLTSIVIPNGVRSIGSSAFYHCYSISSIVIPNGVRSIGNSAFYYCYSLSSMVIPEGVTSIGSSAFQCCYSLTPLVIPNGVTSIGSNAFNSCYSLASIVIPNGVTSIGYSAFYYCYSLTSIVIPNGVTSIGSNTFHSCYIMAYYDFSTLTTVPSLSATNAFTNIPSDCKIIVPDALYNTWIAATNWSTYASNIVKKSDWDAL